VQNSNGSEWNTRCDGQLFIVPLLAEPLVAEPLVTEPVLAVSESLIELFTAHRTRRPPSGNYRALRHVPFPLPGSPRLQDKFSPAWEKSRVEALVESLTWYVKVPWIGPGVGAEQVVRLFAALPELMRQFSQNVAMTYENSESLRERLPAPYVKAFSNIG
jgi:hypothetical protein